MCRLLMPLLLLWLAAGCGQKDAGAGRNSSAPAYVPSAAPASEAAVDDRQGGPAQAADDDLDVAAPEASPPDADDAHRLPDEEPSDDDSQPRDSATSGADASGPHSNTNSASGDDEPAVEPGDGDAAGEASSGQPQGSRVKLFRGLANSVSRAVMKTIAEPSAAPAPPLEDDPFPNGEPADADPDVNR